MSATRAATNLLGFVTTIALARLLTPADFGLVAIGTTLLFIVQAVTDIAMSQALVHHANPTRVHMDTAWTLGMIRGLVIGLAFAASAPLIERFYSDGRLTGVILSLGLTIFIGGLANPRRVLLQRDLIFWQEFVLQVAQKISVVIVSVVVAYFYQSYWALLLGTLIGQVVQVAVSYTAMPYRPRFSVAHGRELWSFSIWLTAMRFVQVVNQRADHLIVGRLFGPLNLGLLTVGENLAAIPTRETTQPLSNTLFPAFSKLRDQPERLVSGYQRAQATITAVALPLGCGFALLADPLVRIAMGPEWIAAIPIIQFMAVMFAFQTLAGIAYSLAMAFGLTKILFRRELQIFMLRTPVLLLAMYYFGFVGVIAVRVFTGLLVVIFNMQIVKSLIGLTFKAQLILSYRAFISVVVMSVAVKILGYTALERYNSVLAMLAYIATAVVLGGAAYSLTSFLLWRVAGKPAGPEAEVRRILSSLRWRFVR